MITLSHMKPSIIITVAVLLIIALVHLLRLLYQTDVTVSATAIPVWASLPALIITAGLAVWLWYENK